MKKAIFALLLLASAGLSAQVYDYKPGISLDNSGVTYFLPKTVIKVKVKVTKETYKPGELSQYAKKELGIDNNGQEAYEKWQIKSLQVVSAGIPDSEKVFFIKYKPKYTAPNVSLTNDGIIKGINIESEEAVDEPEQAKTTKRIPKIEDYLTQEMLLAGSKARKATLIAREIFDIRDSRNLLLRGEAETMPGDNESLKLVLQKLDEQEEALLYPFVGLNTVEEKEYVFEITPEDNIENKILFRFSKHLGIVAENDLSGEPVYFSLHNEETTPVDLLGYDKTSKKNGKLEGAAYNVPGKGEVKLSFKGKVLWKGSIPVTQYGNTEYLDEILFNKNSTIKIKFNPENGAILNIDQQQL